MVLYIGKGTRKIELVKDNEKFYSFDSHFAIHVFLASCVFTLIKQAVSDCYGDL